MPNNWRTIKSSIYKKIDFTLEGGKERLNPSREKNEGKHRRRKVDQKSCVTFLLLLCYPRSRINGKKTTTTLGS